MQKVKRNMLFYLIIEKVLFWVMIHISIEMQPNTR